MRHYIVRKLSTHRSRLRVYLDIRSLAEAGFHPGQQYSRHLDATRKALRLSIEPDGAYVVSRKQKAGEPRWPPQTAPLLASQTAPGRTG